jgi:hypothetical protein
MKNEEKAFTDSPATENLEFLSDVTAANATFGFCIGWDYLKS